MNIQLDLLSVRQIVQQIANRGFDMFRRFVSIDMARETFTRQVPVLLMGMLIAIHGYSEARPILRFEHLLETVEVVNAGACRVGIKVSELSIENGTNFVDLYVPVFADITAEGLPVTAPPAKDADSSGDEGPDVTWGQFLLQLLLYGLPPAVIGTWLGRLTGKRQAARRRRDIEESLERDRWIYRLYDDERIRLERSERDRLFGPPPEVSHLSPASKK